MIPSPLHWLTALLVPTLFAIAQVWDFADRGTPCVWC